MADYKDAYGGYPSSDGYRYSGESVRLSVGSSQLPTTMVQVKRSATYRIEGSSLTLEVLRELVEATKDVPPDSKINVAHQNGYNGEGPWDTITIVEA